MQLKEFLKTSINGHDMKRSAFYCAELCLMYARLGEIEDVVTCLMDMQNYTSEGVTTEVAELLEELNRRRAEINPYSPSGENPRLDGSRPQKYRRFGQKRIVSGGSSVSASV